MGRGAMTYNITGAYNTAVGQYALILNTGGSNNSAFGRYALRNNTASNNTAVGFLALRQQALITLQLVIKHY
jgi:trimeric autotransporter adhesin